MFSVEYTFAAPPENPMYNGPTPATFIIGDTRAAVTRAPETVGGADGGLGVAPGTTAGTTPTGAVPGTAAVPGADLAGIGAVPAAPGGVPTVNLSPQAGAASDGVSLVGVGLPAFLGSDFSSIYLGLLGLTVLGLLAAVVLGTKGVSARWNS